MTALGNETDGKDKCKMIKCLEFPEEMKDIFLDVYSKNKKLVVIVTPEVWDSDRHFATSIIANI